MTGGGWQGFVTTGSTFTNISEPGAWMTYANGINGDGAIVGAYEAAPGKAWNGFVYANGTYTTLSVAGATTTVPEGINDSGDVVGYYTNAAGTHGFLATPDAEFVPLPVIGGTLPGGLLLLGWLGRRFARRRLA